MDHYIRRHDSGNEAIVFFYSSPVSGGRVVVGRIGVAGNFSKNTCLLVCATLNTNVLLRWRSALPCCPCRSATGRCHAHHKSGNRMPRPMPVVLTAAESGIHQQHTLAGEKSMKTACAAVTAELGPIPLATRCRIWRRSPLPRDRDIGRFRSRRGPRILRCLSTLWRHS